MQHGVAELLGASDCGPGQPEADRNRHRSLVAGKLDQVGGGKSHDRDHQAAEEDLHERGARIGPIEELPAPLSRAPRQRERIEADADHQADDDKQHAESAQADGGWEVHMVRVTRQHEQQGGRQRDGQEELDEQTAQPEPAIDRGRGLRRRAFFGSWFGDRGVLSASMISGAGSWPVYWPSGLMVRFRKCAMVPMSSQRATAALPLAPDLTSLTISVS